MNLKEKRVILFDNDGVLTHTESFWLNTNLAITQQLGIPYTRDDFIRHTFTTGLGSDGWLSEAGYAEQQRAEFRSLRDEHVRTGLLVGTTADPQAHEVIVTLKLRYRIAVVTNTNKEFFALLAGHFDFLNQFNEHILREDYQDSKPAPDSYIIAIKKLQVQPEEAIVIEDSPRGIAAAKAAGLAVIGIQNPDFPELDLSAADYQVATLAELLTLF